MVVSGAYGRDYKSKAAVLSDWKAGKDFFIRDMYTSGGHHVNCRDNVPPVINVRYSNDYKVAVLTLRGGEWNVR